MTEFNSSGNATSDSDQIKNPSQPTKRKRLHGSCDACRRKKSDSALRPDNFCSNCINCRIQCTHEASKRKKRPEHQTEHIQALEDRVQQMEAYLKNTVNRTLDLSFGPPQLTSSAADFRLKAPILPTDRTGGVLRPSHISPTVSPVDADDLSDKDDLSHVTLAEKLKNLSFDITENRFFGKSSMFLAAQNAMELQNQSEESAGSMPFAPTKRPIYWQLRNWEREYLYHREPPYTLPDPDLLATLIRAYFDNVHVFLPVVHRPTFEKEVRHHLHLKDPSFAATLLVVCALASRYCKDPRVYIDGDEASAGFKYISQVPLASSVSLVHSSIHDLQRYALAAYYFQGSSLNQTSWNLTGLGLRLAVDRGLHRRQSLGYRPTKSLELGRRVFWCLVAIDRGVSSCLGRPCALADEDIDAEYPIMCDDEFWETEDPTQAFVQPPGRPPTITAFNLYLGLCETVSSILRTMYSTKKCKILHGMIGEDWEKRILTEVDNSLAKMRQETPKHLLWCPEIRDPALFNQAAFLYCMSCYVRILAHRPMLKKNTLLSSASAIICRDEARQCSRALGEVNKRGGITNPALMMAAFASALTLITDLRGRSGTANQEQVGQDRMYVEHCKQYLTNGELRQVLSYSLQLSEALVLTLRNRWHGAARLV
ncbi:hypothetical protein FA15DRAFT_596705 [Coprinopsis marcescibilis]|uniref:Xylanolytic transcriptional activator regulatory domain-containing protein n=1 Tax=Coprinopsis marcescibilis TaxID=230819 RepID=A0A5C3KNP1_COPMA|nr:hypothetical protein FA15DRAFT_596705 [Coprinopsis marcescibilis]